MLDEPSPIGVAWSLVRWILEGLGSLLLLVATYILHSHQAWKNSVEKRLGEFHDWIVEYRAIEREREKRGRKKET